MSPEAGWYADPTDPSAVRWWDGARWSAQTRPHPTGPTPPGGQAAEARAASGRHAAPSDRGTASSATAVVDRDPEPALRETAPVSSPTPARTPPPAPQQPGPGDVVDRSRPGSHAAASPRVPVPQAGPSDVVDRSRPGSYAAPAAAAATDVADRSRPGSYAAPAAAAATEVADRSRPGSRPSAASTAPAAVVTAPPVAWVDSPGAAPAGLGGPPPGFGMAPPSLGPALSGVVQPTAYRAPRSRKGPIIGLLVILLVLGAGAAVGVPRYLTAQALAVADAQPDVLVRTAPTTLAGQHQVTVKGVSTANLAGSMTSAGSSWAWAQAYGTATAVTLYVAGDVPVSERPTAVRALTSHDAAQDLLASVSSSLAAGAGGSLVTGAPTEYASPVSGKTWCMPITVSGVAGGFCLWTSGKELLETASLPGLQEVAAKSTLQALTQMVAATTKSHGGAAPVGAKPSSTA